MSARKCLSKNNLYQIVEYDYDGDGRRVREFKAGNKAIRYLTPGNSDGDVVEDEYEGGHQVWQGTLTALCHFSNNLVTATNVLDIGCGNGLLGIFFQKYCNAQKVVFQDLNERVIKDATTANIRLNQLDMNHCDFITGPWPACFEALPSNAFDIIVTSDTVYREKNFPILHDMFDRLLDKGSESRIFVCGKDFYFGNDGGMLQFRDFVDSRPVFETSIAFSDTGNVGHTLLELRRPLSSCLLSCSATTNK